MTEATTSAERGLSLIELLVILAIVSFGVAVVVLNTPPPRSSVRTAAEAFAAQISLARDRAIMAGETRRLILQPSGWRAESFRNGEWRSVEDRRSGPRSFPADLSVQFEINDPTFLNEPETDEAEGRNDDSFVFLDPTGASTPFNAFFASDGDRWRVSLSETGEVGLHHDRR